MPGNDFGERIHNFFGQEGLPQGQHQSQVVEGSWPSFSNGLLVGSQRQRDSSLVSNLKSYNAQQTADPEEGQSSNAQHGLNFTQQPIRSEYSRGHLQNHQQPANGYMHGNQVLQAMQREANFLGMDAESGGHRLTSKGIPPDLHKIQMRSDMEESPVNFDFFGGQQQVNSQSPGMLHSLSRQHMGFNDMQLLQQQVMIKQMHEYQMQQQLQKQQLEARQMNSFNQAAVNGSRLGDNHSHPLIDGIPLRDASNNSWQHEIMMANTNLLQRSISPVVQHSSGGLMFTPEQGQMNFTGSVPQQFEHSLYGMPVTGARGLQNGFSAMQMNKLTHENVSASNNSALASQHSAFSNQGDIHESNMVPRPSSPEKLLFSHTSIQSSNSRLNFENLQQDDSHVRNISVQEKFIEKQESTDPSEKSCMKMPENMTASKKVATLDPTEEKILFGSDDNLWDAFGNSTIGNNLASGSDIVGSFPSLQSGSWSALMQSAVAETSSGDAGTQKWGSKRQSVWADNNTDALGNSQNSLSAQDSGFKASIAQNERVHRDATQTAVKYFQDKGSKFLNHGLLEKPMAEPRQVVGNNFCSSSSGFNVQNNSCPTREDEGIGDKLGTWKAASNSNLAGAVGQKNFFTHNLQIQRVSSGFASACVGNDPSTVRDVQGNIQQHLNNNSMEKAVSQMNSRESKQILESPASENAGKTAAETNGKVNSPMENSGDGFRSNIKSQASASGFRESAHVNVRGSSLLPGGEQMQSGHVGHRPLMPRKFQYHPMGNIDVSDEPGREKVTHLPPMFQQVPGGEQWYFGQSNSIGLTAVNRGMEKGHVSQGDLNCPNEASLKGMYQDDSPSISSSVDGIVDRGNQVKGAASSRQTMLELLHKVDQSQDHVMGTSVSGLPEAKTSAETGGQLQHNQASAPQGFSLQLAPPSQPVTSPDNAPFPRSSLQAVKSLNPIHNASEKGGMSQSKSVPWTSNQAFLHQETHKGAFPGIPGQINCSSGFPFSRPYQQNQQMSAATRPSAANQSVNSLFKMSTSQVKERDGYGEIAQHRQLAQMPPQLSPNTDNNNEDLAKGYTMQEAMSASQPRVASSSSEQGLSSAMMSGSMVQRQSSKPHPDIVRSHLFPNNSLEGRLAGQEKTNQTAQNGGEGPSAGGNLMNKLELQGKDITAKHASDAASMFSKLAQNNLQTLGRSFMPHNLSKEKNAHYLEHMAANGEDNSTNNRVVNRGECSLADPKNLAPRGEQQSPLGSDGLVRDGLVQSKESVHPIGPTVSQSFSNKNLVASAYASKNGLVQPLNDACGSTPLRMAEQSSITGKFADGSHSGQASKELVAEDPGQVELGAETLSSESLPPRGATEQLLSVDRPKKRKTAMSGFVSWSKEVMLVSQRLQTLSESEVDWARATNRLPEKLEAESELLEDVPPVLRSKRRLMFTTQLVQQLFRPPPARLITSLNANSNYDTVVYTAMRAALGDACSSISTARSERFGPPNDENPLKTAEKISDQYISKAAEEFNGRTQRLESEFSRVEKGTTFPDLRVEVQELEKFSVINRFAKFHARGPLDGTETSSSTDRTLSSVRLYPQRYVTVAPMPRNVPDSVQCLSL
ncbi:PREDICTED: uncharacterized protein LOC104818516 [Tarenaya hassleriana]|uniref:uncharacterized protein LOC104818516 n=1 Tax=Tarenaya hassleriana TaxID=28532 RepID=UPI00053C29A4|nr:PREDICTED: uncharacterized protein LOC104818516 [Tarenaya hassleriana]